MKIQIRNKIEESDVLAIPFVSGSEIVIDLPKGLETEEDILIFATQAKEEVYNILKHLYDIK